MRDEDAAQRLQQLAIDDDAGARGARGEADLVRVRVRIRVRVRVS